MKKLLSLLGVVSLASIGTTSVVACKGDGLPSIGLLISNQDNAYFQNMMKAGKEYIESKGYKLNTYDSKGTNQATSDLENVNAAITKGDEAIIINPSDPGTGIALDPAIKANIPIVNVDIVFDKAKVPNRGAAGFVSEQVKAEDQTFNFLYEKIKGYKPGQNPANKKNGSTDKTEKLDVYVMRSSKENGAEKKRFEGFVTENKEYINVVNHGKVDENGNNTGVNDQGSLTKDNLNTGDAAYATFAGDWLTSGNSAKNADVIWVANDPMSLGIANGMRINPTPEYKEWFKKGKSGNGGYITGFDGSEDMIADIHKWSETDREHVYITVKQEYALIIQAAIDEAIKLIEAGGTTATQFDKETEVAATVKYANGNGGTTDLPKPTN